MGDDDRRLSKHWPTNATSRLFIGLAGASIYFLAGLIGRAPRFVEAVYAVIAPPLVWLMSRVTGLFPFSITELIYLAYATWLVTLAWRGLRSVQRRERPATHALVGGATRLVRDAGLVVGFFYLLWGFNYVRPSLEQRLDWPAWAPGDVDELAELSAALIDQGNEAYRTIHGVDDVGTATVLPHGIMRVHEAIESSWESVASELNLPSHLGWKYGRPKYLASSAIYARLGITGFYFPFTAEANVRWGLPALSLPQSVAHEKAHQRGIASEDEASFLGFVAGVLADDPYVRYSSIMFAQRQLTAALARADRDRWRELADTRIPGVQRDLQHLSEYFRQFVGVGTAVGRSVNDRFLRANRVEGGVLSYGRVARLLITFSRLRQGEIIPPHP